MDREKQNRLSAEWAAYGDALGFMTELADAGRVQYRIGADQVENTVPWRRKVGGYSGASVDFPAGSYSDDTQLRLSTSRSIRADGTFDVAAFAKVELTAWANYALGAGIGSKEAASNLARTSATWYSNFFDSKRASYLSAGGNGAAMRVQPHAWAARDLSDERQVLLDVFRNSICTHGHPRGIIGACFHACSLIFALREGRPARLLELNPMVEQLRSLSSLIQSDGDLRLFWLGAWEEASGTSFEEAAAVVLQEIEEDLALLERFEGAQLPAIYVETLEALGGYEPSSRGSGTKTAIIAAFAASLSDISDPRDSLLTIINALGSDTDSIATMAGSIIGACTNRECDGTIQDREYIQSEAIRLASVAERREVTSFRYPDLRSWKPARAAIDAIGVLEGKLWLSGLGQLEPLDRMMRTGADAMGWCQLPFGQTILARIRSDPNPISPAQAGLARSSEQAAGRDAPPPPGKLRDLFGQGDPRSAATSVKPDIQVGVEGLTLNELLQKVVSEGFPAELIGRILLEQVDSGAKDFAERGIALTANILTAYEARSRRRRR
ncbi:ADP-ribosylglycohydrolase family protein [Sphingobium rhizovicinum]|uniref:ADP-ribosylglycohydrolase family protein n=1 Tax=Sphingobium rhizovicinum TaxID=432308 RepID=A0ABV7NL61_9SPHN